MIDAQLKSVDSGVAVLPKTKEQRRKAYARGGVYCVTEAVLLLDLVDQRVLDPLTISHLLFFPSHPPASIHDPLGWSFTLLRQVNRTALSCVVVREAWLYSQELAEGLLRLAFASRCLLWPFGRRENLREIATALRFEEFEIEVAMDPWMGQLHALVHNLI
jgi:hypothetical protein